MNAPISADLNFAPQIYSQLLNKGCLKRHAIDKGLITLIFVFLLMPWVYASATSNNRNLCSGASITVSSGSSNQNNIIDGDPKPSSCSGCASIVQESGVSSIRIDLGSVRSLSTIVFHGDWSDTTDYGTSMTRQYGTTGTIDDASNIEITQAGGTNYATMIADINDGSSKSVQYIHWRVTGSDFTVSQILCYEKKRMYDSDMSSSYWYILPQNGAVANPNGCASISNGDIYIEYAGDYTIWRTVVINKDPISDSGNNIFKKFEMDQNNGSDKKSCEFDEDENGYDCYTETNNNAQFPHDRMMIEIDGSSNERSTCIILLLEDNDGTAVDCSSLTPATHDASRTYTVGDAEDELDVGAFTFSPSGCTMTYSVAVLPSASFMTELSTSRGYKWSTSSESDVGSYTVTVTATSGSLIETTSYTVDIQSAYCTSMIFQSHTTLKTYTVGDAEDELDVGAFTLIPSTCTHSYATTVSPSASFMTTLGSNTGMKWSTSSEADVSSYTVTITATSGSYTETTSYTVDIQSAFCTSMTAPSHTTQMTYTVGDAEDQLDVGSFTLVPTTCTNSYATTVSPSASFMTVLGSNTGMKWFTSSEADVSSYTVTITATSGSLTETTSYTVDIQSALCTSMTAPSHTTSMTYTVGDAEDQLDVGSFTLDPITCAHSYATTVSPSASFMTTLGSNTGMKWSTSSEADVSSYTVTITATSGSLTETTFYTVDIQSAIIPCAANTFTNNPFTGGSYVYTIESTATTIPFPTIFVDFNTDDDANCTPATITWAESSTTWFTVETSQFKIETSDFTIATNTYTVSPIATFTFGSTTFSAALDIAVTITNPCETGNIINPPTFTPSAQSIEFFSSGSATITAPDTTFDTALNLKCGTRMFSIDSISPGSSGISAILESDQITITISPLDITQIGTTFTIFVEANLADYSSVSPVQGQFTADLICSLSSVDLTIDTSNWQASYEVGQASITTLFSLSQTPSCGYGENFSYRLLDPDTSAAYTTAFSSQFITFDQAARTLSLYTNDGLISNQYLIEITGESSGLSDIQTFQVNIWYDTCNDVTITLDATKTLIGYVIGFEDIFYEIPYTLSMTNCGLNEFYLTDENDLPFSTQPSYIQVTDYSEKLLVKISNAVVPTEQSFKLTYSFIDYASLASTQFVCKIWQPVDHSFSFEDQFYVVNQTALEVQIDKLVLHNGYQQSSNVQFKYALTLSDGQQLPDFIIDTGDSTLEVYSEDEDDAGAYEISVSAIQPSGSAEAYSIEQALMTNFTVFIWAVNYTLMENLPYFEHQFDAQIMFVGDEWEYQIPNAMSNLDGMISYEVELKDAFVFTEFDKDNNTLRIAKDETNKDDVGTYQIFITLVDQYGNKADPAILTLMLEERELIQSESAEEILNEMYKEAIVEAQARKEKYKTAQFEKPNVYITEINMLGKIHLKFSNQMYVPTQYSLINGERYHQRNLVAREDFLEAVQVSILPQDEYHNYTRNLDFSWNVTEFDEYNLGIQLNFSDAVQVSSFSQADKVQITFLDERLFFDFAGQNINEGTTIIRELPSQIQLEGLGVKLKELSDSIELTTSFTVTANFIWQLLVSASLQHLWSMINSQQIIVMISLFHISLPSNLASVFQIILKIAAFDILPIDRIMQKIYDVEHTEPISANFEAMGFESLYLIQNLGSLFLITLSIPILILLLPVMKFMGYRFTKMKTLYRATKQFLFWNFQIRFITESYTILIIGCMISSKNLTWTSFANVFNSSLAYLMFTILIGYPFFMLYQLNRYHDQLSKRSFKLQFGQAYEGLATTKGKAYFSYFLLFFMRRLLLAYVVVYTIELLIVQIFVMNLTIVLALVIVGSFRVFQKISLNKEELVNELWILLVQYNAYIFSDFNRDGTTKYIMGFFSGVSILLHLFVNLYLIVQRTIKHTFKMWRIKRAIAKYEVRHKKQTKYSAKNYSEKRQKWFKKIEESNGLSVEDSSESGISRSVNSETSQQVILDLVRNQNASNGDALKIINQLNWSKTSGCPQNLETPQEQSGNLIKLEEEVDQLGFDKSSKILNEGWQYIDETKKEIALITEEPTGESKLLSINLVGAFYADLWPSKLEASDDQIIQFGSVSKTQQDYYSILANKGKIIKQAQISSSLSCTNLPNDQQTLISQGDIIKKEKRQKTIQEAIKQAKEQEDSEKPQREDSIVEISNEDKGKEQNPHKKGKLLPRQAYLRKLMTKKENQSYQ